MKPFTRQNLVRSVMVMAMVAGAGCGQRLTDSNLEQVVPDMSKKEVESILGQPTAIKTHELTLQTQMKTLSATRYYYDQADQEVELIFVDDKLVGRNGYFDPGSALATRVAEKANSDQPIPGIDTRQLIMPRAPLKKDGVDAPEEEATVGVVAPAVEPPLPEAEEGAAVDPTPAPDQEETDP